MTIEELDIYWGQPDRKHTDNQIRLINLAQFQYWEKGEPVPSDLFMEMTEAGLTPTQLETYYKEN